MANVEEKKQWEEGIYLIDINDPVVGGPDGVDNIPHKHLANRTLYLKDKLESINLELSAIQAEIAGLTPESIGAAPAVHSHSDLSLPAGIVNFFARQTPPDGWLECNGAEISRTQYARLFSAIGTTFGSGDGSTTFKLPDLRGEFIRGWDHGREIDANRQFGSWQEDELEEHTHNLKYGIEGDYGYPELGATGNTINPDVSANDANAIAKVGGTETRPRNVALLPCIKC